MPERESKRAVYVEKRARALLLMLLTRRTDLRIEELTEDDIGLDFIVRFHTEGKEGLREFAIQLKGIQAAPTKDDANKVVRPVLRQTKRFGPFLRPVCLVMFTMEGDDGWYTWAAEPIQTEDGKSVLRSSDEPDCRPLNKRTLNEIIERVDAWHEGLYPTLVANGPAGGAKR